MQKITGTLFTLICIAGGVKTATADDLSGWLMQDENEEASLALSAAPAPITGKAGVHVLSANGYRQIRESRNGFNCLVERAFRDPSQSKVRAPICYDAEASSTVMQMKMIVAKSAMTGLSREEIDRVAHAAFSNGKVKAPTYAAFAYMFSADQYLGEQAGAFLPHMMVYAPYYDNDKLGGNTPGSNLPQLFESPGTAFSTAVIPVDPALAIKTK